MKRIVYILPLIILFSCIQLPPRAENFVGTWIADDNSEINLEKTGLFTCKSIPVGYANPYLLTDPGNLSINGSGFWKIQKGETNFELSLNFTEISNEPKTMDYYILNIDRNTLFVWIDEPGGEALRFKRK